MDITPEQKDLIVSAIKERLSPDAEVFFFGSRVDGTSRATSDLDVLLKDSSKIPLHSIALIREKLEESDLPFKVDLLDYHSCSEQMLENIRDGIVKV